jgi:hypothetical protein
MSRGDVRMRLPRRVDTFGRSRSGVVVVVVVVLVVLVVLLRAVVLGDTPAVVPTAERVAATVVFAPAGV